MKKLKIGIALLVLPMFAHADGEFSMQDVNTSMQQQEQTPFIEYHNRMAVFGPAHQVYERIKTDALYAGIEAWLVNVENSKSHHSLLGEAEFRMGYNYFYNGRDHVTPFLGVGFIKNYRSHNDDSYFWGHDSKHRFIKLPAVAYGVLGFLYDHEFNSIFNLGFNLKGMVGGGVNKKNHDWGNPVYGFDASLPITFRFGHKRHWDFRIEPFDIYLRGKDINMNYFGFRSTLGYRF